MNRALRWTLPLLVIALASCERGRPASSTPEEVPRATTPALDPEQLAEDLRVLADDGWAGRYTKDLEHLGLAADYIAKSHADAGLRPVGNSYRVDFEYPAGTKPGDAFYLWVERGDDAHQLPAADVLPAAFGAARAVVGQPVWIDADASAGVDGRIVLTPAPQGDAGARLRDLAEAGASAVLWVTASLPERPAAPTSAPISAAWISNTTATEVLGMPEASPPERAAPVEGLRVSLARTEEDDVATAPNVLAWIEGTQRPEEIVLLGAHYDHIGTKDFGTFCRGPSDDAEPDDTVCNGADDNASGTALLMDIARAIASSGYRPKRTLVFAHFAAEELGLHGSRALAESPPPAVPFSDGRVVAMLNMDMVGRLGEEGLQVGGEKTSSAWPQLIARAAPTSLEIVHPESVTGRSDHAHWYRAGVPVLFFFTGLHEDYHRTSDELSTLNMAGIADIGALVLGITLQLADGAAVPALPKE